MICVATAAYLKVNLNIVASSNIPNNPYTVLNGGEHTQLESKKKNLIGYHRICLIGLKLGSLVNKIAYLMKSGQIILGRKSNLKKNHENWKYLKKKFL